MVDALENSEFAWQSMHVSALEAPRVVEYFPAGHAAQVSVTVSALIK
jgi:hypothetical protein